MTMQFSVSVRNAQLDAIETDTGTSAKLMIYTGSPPISCAAAATGTLLVQFNLASDWAAAASGGTKILNNLPIGTPGSVTGTAGYFRLYKSDGTTCQAQGTVTLAGGGGDIIIDQLTITSGQTVTITAATFAQGGA